MGVTISMSSNEVPIGNLFNSSKLQYSLPTISINELHSLVNLGVTNEGFVARSDVVEMYTLSLGVLQKYALVFGIVYGDNME